MQVDVKPQAANPYFKPVLEKDLDDIVERSQTDAPVQGQTNDSSALNRDDEALGMSRKIVKVKRRNPAGANINTNLM